MSDNRVVNVDVDFNDIVRSMKPMHGVGQPPLKGGFYKLDFSHCQYLKDAYVPYSRLHDVGGAFGSSRFVDIPNVFRNFDADENDSQNYDFTFTDWLLLNLQKHNVKPIYRLGVTIENDYLDEKNKFNLKEGDMLTYELFSIIYNMFSTYFTEKDLAEIIGITEDRFLNLKLFLSSCLGAICNVLSAVYISNSLIINLLNFR